jgi:hypothetical protein
LSAAKVELEGVTIVIRGMRGTGFGMRHVWEAPLGLGLS